MKKLLLLILILAGAVYWGMSEGNDISRGVEKPHTPKTVSAKGSAPSQEQKSEKDGMVELIKDISNTIFNGISKEATPAGTAETVPPKSTDKDISKKIPTREQAAAEVETLQQKWNNVAHFQTALESRIDRKKFVPSDEIPDLLKKGIIATEDRRYYDHGAIDLIGVCRAFITNAAAGHTMEGGSTIAQQTVKNIFLSNERTMERKVEELALAMQLEKYYSKDQILEIYLNTIYFGHGAYGVGPASRTYFGKEPKDLDLSQCAMLAGLPQAPSAYDPLDHPQEGAKRMTMVLALMAQEGYITPEQAAQSALNLWLK
ncbi:transglycosylase domain-containing protein [Dialister sp.]|uniref:transglycosylase domain-containing protein n=1 Tax=Dialister sp. TaxID=1955814 RepID=UPI002E810B65|nr:biosynthetic peptidoglycan transglycosylase [Dialister sp.]MEE3453367.1 biosynthetic peptidoglycan transglycosylase [Dialister sp.]